MKDSINIPLEQSLLASIIYDPQIFMDIESELSCSDFGYKPHQEIYNIMLSLYQADLPINEEFIRNKAPQGVNIDNEVFELVATTPIADIKAYVKEIKDLSLKRKLHHLANTIKEKSLLSSVPSLDIINEIESEVFRLQSSKESSEFRGFDEVTLSMLDGIKELKQRGNEVVIGLRSGFSELDICTAGLKQGELIIVAARPGMGKTAFALNLIQPTLRQGKCVAFFSLEMDAEQLSLRIFSTITNIPLQQLRVGNLDDQEWQYFSDACEQYSSWKLKVDDNAGLNISQLRTKLRKLKLKEPDLSLVVIDYLQIMSGMGNKDRHLEVADISRGLKNLARELKIPIVALSQLNRTLEGRSNRRPMLSDLRESGSIEQDADIILFLYRDAVYKRQDQKERIEQAKKEGKEAPKEEIIPELEIEDVELIIGKHRNGALKTIKLHLQTKCTRFIDIATHHIIEQPQTKILESSDENIDMPPI